MNPARNFPSYFFTNSVNISGGSSNDKERMSIGFEAKIFSKSDSEFPLKIVVYFILKFLFTLYYRMDKIKVFFLLVLSFSSDYPVIFIIQKIHQYFRSHGRQE